MRCIIEAKERELVGVWIGYPRPEDDLWADGEGVAMLHWQRGSIDVAETAEGRWRFKHLGFGRLRVSVDGTPLVHFKSRQGSDGDARRTAPRMTSRHRRYCRILAKHESVYGGGGCD